MRNKKDIRKIWDIQSEKEKNERKYGSENEASAKKYIMAVNEWVDLDIFVQICHFFVNAHIPIKHVADGSGQIRGKKHQKGKRHSQDSKNQS